MTSTLRRRNVLLDDPGSSAGLEPQGALLKKVAESADFFPKPKEDYQRRQTPLGAWVSVFTFSVIIFLLFVELLGYVVGWSAYRSELSVDPGISAKVPVHFDITFFSIPCHALTLDAMDAAGSEETDVAHDLFKSPVDRRGNLVFIGKYNYVEQKLSSTAANIQYDAGRDPKSPQFCGKCYITPVAHHHGYDRVGGPLDAHMGEKHNGECCNTCEQVMLMYDRHGIPRPHINEVEQCITELSHANPGCNIRGLLELRKVKGNFHFAPGQTISLGPMGQHLHQFTIDDLLAFNTSHRINEFAIGDPSIPRFSKYGVKFPLEGMGYVVREGVGQMKYFIQVVPTVYQNGPSELTKGALEAAVPELSFEYSAQYGHTEFDPFGSIGKTPSLFFVFDFHPIQVTHIFERPPLGRFLVRLCCIVGGLFVMLSLLDSLLFSLLAAIRERLSSTGPIASWIQKVTTPS